MEDRLRKLIAVMLNLNEEDINDETGLKTCNSWTSKKHINIIVAIEEEFGIPQQLTIEEIIQMVNIGKIKEILKRKGTNGN